MNHPSFSRSQIIERAQRAIHKAVDPLIAGAEDCCVLDFPDHPNVGDSAIWAGEIAYLRELEISPDYVCTKDKTDWSAVEQTKGPILLHGGGNFGDVWPEHQRYRNEVLRRFPRRRIIQMPQTVHFSSEAAAAESRDVIQHHGDFTLLVRDQVSVEKVERHLQLAPVLVPDMAFCLGTLSSTASRCPLLLLLRTDHESRGYALDSEQVRPGVVHDWMSDDRGFYKKEQFKAAINPANWSSRRYAIAKYNGLAFSRLTRGVRMLSEYNYIITDRLHCHILSLMLNKQHTVIDNNYGKISNFMDVWTRDYMGVETSPSAEVALRSWQSTHT